ncbi:hypothetical protein AYO38_02700 [bacterium SCGC AG-212-C10]|nr:hypothetical protein AYO38_02700 [bacterium SCGC AG-212-C10]
MRYIIYGAGGIGGGIGARLFMAGHDVVLICRGAHYDAIAKDGLLLKTPDGEHRLQIPVAKHPSEITFGVGDAVILTMKTQDTESALRDLEIAAGGADLPIVCAQNGVENERMASRRFRRVYAMLVAMPATFVTPGEVVAWAAPNSGCLHAGAYPGGTDDAIAEICAGLHGSKFHSLPDPQVMRLKYAKLLLNLGNGIEVVTGGNEWGVREGDAAGYVEHCREEARAVYTAAGIEWAPPEEYAERVTAFYKHQQVGSEPRAGGSTFQSVVRGQSAIEVDYLNGEICLLGKLTGIATPYNDVIRRVSNEIASFGAGPGGGKYTIADLHARVAAR